MKMFSLKSRKMCWNDNNIALIDYNQYILAGEEKHFYVLNKNQAKT